MKKIDGVRISILGYGVLWVRFQRFFWCVLFMIVKLKGCVWVLTEQEEVGEFENNWVGKGGEL